MDAYYHTRYVPDPARGAVWQEIVRFLGPFLPAEGTVVDLGAGYCDFINRVPARTRYAVDVSPELPKHAAAGVIHMQAPAWDLRGIPDAGVDVVHASNLFEHFDDEELARVMGEVRRVLKPGGTLILLQPNFRLCVKRYFDDPTHKKVFTDASLRDFLVSHGFRIVLAKPRFLPFSLRSRPGLIPPLPILARLYLRSPFKPFAGQMLFVAQKA